MSAGPLLAALLIAAAKACLLLALAAGLAAALGKAPARARHGVWAVALAGALLLPALAPWLPSWRIEALPAPALLAPPPAAGDNGASPDRLRGTARALLAPEPGPRAHIDRPAPSAAVVPPATSPWARARALGPAAWLLFLWLVGCLASAAWLLRAHAAARRLERRAALASPDWQEVLARAARRVGLRRPVRLLLSHETGRPMTWGWRRPVVVLPAAARCWSTERRRVVLLHELAHVHRADWLVRLMARLACSLYWFNPLAWLAGRSLILEQELACDEEVVALGTLPSSYAGHLLAIARTLGPATAIPGHALDMARRSQMEGRLMSILDGGRRSSGGRGLAILALLLLAGLVPALAAIEPWVADQEETEAATRSGQSTATAVAGTEGVARVVGELEALQRRMEPFEAELEGLEAEMEPMEKQLESIEMEMEPVEVDFEGFEAELGPFEAQLEAIELEMEPFQAELEAIDFELEPFEVQLEAIEHEMEPFEERLEAIEGELEPFERRLEAIEVEMEPLARHLEELAEQLEPLALAGGKQSAERDRLVDEMQKLHERMNPLHERMGAIHEEMQPVFERMSAVHREMEPLHRRMGVVHDEMVPIFESMSAVHEQLEPLRRRMGTIHEEMQPVFERLGAAHERLAPYHQRMGERHEAMKPLHRRMGEVHQRMEPLFEEMKRRHEELERELQALVERMLAIELAGVTAAGTDYAPAADRIVEAVSLRVDDGTLRVMSSAPQLRRIVDDSLAGSKVVPGQEFATAVDHVVRLLTELEVTAGG